MNRLIKKMWDNRGYSNEWLQSINQCNHRLPTNIPELCARLKYYHDAAQRVVLLTDFDMDGITAGIIGFAGLAELGFNAALYLPSTDNYGFTERDIIRIKNEYPDVKAILTADVGITAYAGIQYAKDAGIEVLLTDHHMPTGSELPSASVVVDPRCDNGEEYFGEICGAHVLYLILSYYAEHFSDNPLEMVPQIERLRVFAGFGTISDSMPVWYENRPLVRDAISICRLIYGDGTPDMVNSLSGCAIYRRAFLGLFLMLKAFQERGKIKDGSSIDETFFAFYVAPAFNSIKRMSGSVEMAYQVFFGGEEASIENMERILVLTDERKALVEESLHEMLHESDQPWAPYIYVTDAPVGIRGLLAQRVLSLTSEPVLVVGDIGDGQLAGSGRCPGWFPFLDLTKDLDYVHGAGHNPAFGVKLDDAAACDALVVFFREKIEIYKPEDADLRSRPDFKISTVDDAADTDIDVELFEDFLEELEIYRPFGAGFPAPDLELEFRPMEASWSYLGKDKNHIKVVLPHGFVLVCFNQAAYFPKDIYVDQLPKVISVRGHLNLNEYAGIKSVQFMGSFGEEVDQRDLVREGDMEV